MGSSILKLLVITYISHLKYRALSICHPCVFFTGYVDDILMLTSFRNKTERILTAFNNIEVDTKSRQHGISIAARLSIEIAGRMRGPHRFLRESSQALPIGAKIGYARNGIARIQRKCSWTEDKATHTTCFLDVF